MDRYIEFNPIKFLQESKTWASRKKELTRELESIGDLSAVVNDGMPHGTDIGRPTERNAIKRYELVEQIRAIERYQAMYEYAINQLSQAEIEVLDIFFFKGGYMPPKIDKYGYKYGLCRSDVYKARRLALEHLTQIISEKLQ